MGSFFVTNGKKFFETVASELTVNQNAVLSRLLGASGSIKRVRGARKGSRQFSIALPQRS
jgi:hypothetical protein